MRDLTDTSSCYLMISWCQATVILRRLAAPLRLEVFFFKYFGGEESGEKMLRTANVVYLISVGSCIYAIIDVFLCFGVAVRSRHVMKRNERMTTWNGPTWFFVYISSLFSANVIMFS